jgi:glyoxylase-like metal-dependent hydrolase (beta-lactamase superfamily II)
MLIFSSGYIQPELLLLTTGAACHYCVGSPDNYYLIDPGISAHIPALIQRLNKTNYIIKNCRGILMTHLHADRIGGIPSLLKLNPSIQLFASPTQKQALSKKSLIEDLHKDDAKLSALFELGEALEQISKEKFINDFNSALVISDSDILEISHYVSLKTFPVFGHTETSLAFIIDPYSYFILDETAGYYNGRLLAGPGFDNSITAGIASIKKILDMEISGLCLPYNGILTADLIRKHLSAVLQNTEDLINESKKAVDKKLSEQEVLDSIKDNLFSQSSKDPLIKLNASRTIDGLWRQIKAR